MTNISKLLPALLLLLIACEEERKNIFWISAPDGSKNDLLYMAESTNVPRIDPDSLHFYLSKQELGSVRKHTYRNFGKIRTDEEFEVFVLLKEGSEEGRDYTFLIRTYDRELNLIDSFEFATWIDSENRHCYGSIDEQLTIKRFCRNGENEEVKQVMEDGTIKRL